MSESLQFSIKIAFVFVIGVFNIASLTGAHKELVSGDGVADCVTGFTFSFSDLLRRANQGDINAAYELGWRYSSGDGVVKDEKEAIKWYELVAEQNYACALNILGVYYAEGKGVEKDDIIAANYFKKAAQLDDSHGQHNLGLSLLLGQGVEKNDIEGTWWIANAALQGHEDSEEILFRHCIISSRPEIIRICRMYHMALECDITLKKLEELMSILDLKYKDIKDIEDIHMLIIPEICESLDAGAQTLVHIAITKNHLDLVCVLVKKADINTQDAQGRTPLLHAAQLGHAQIVKLLMDAGANPNIKDHEGHDANYWLERNMH